MVIACFVSNSPSRLVDLLVIPGRGMVIGGPPFLHGSFISVSDGDPGEMKVISGSFQGGITMGHINGDLHLRWNLTM